MNNLYRQLVEEFGKKDGEEMMRLITLGYSIDGAIQKVIFDE